MASILEIENKLESLGYVIDPELNHNQLKQFNKQDSDPEITYRCIIQEMDAHRYCTLSLQFIRQGSNPYNFVHRYIIRELEDIDNLFNNLHELVFNPFDEEKMLKIKLDNSAHL